MDGIFMIVVIVIGYLLIAHAPLFERVFMEG